MLDATHSIRMAAKLSGLTAHVIRIWEKRYGAVTPTRTATNRRHYSEVEIERLRLLKSLTSLGHGIGSIAALPTLRLQALMGSQTPIAHSLEDRSAGAGLSREEHLENCFEAVRRLDSQGLNKALGQALTGLGHQGFLVHVAAPLAQRLGEAWRAGELTAASEHLATAALKVFLGNTSRPFPILDTAPGILVTTPAGQLHEIGAVIAAAAATNAGWRVTYLGCSLPAAEIAGAVARNGCRALALSIVYPTDDPNLPGELSALRSFLPAETRIVVGGRAAGAYSEALKSIQASRVEDLNQFTAWLDTFRSI